MKTDSPETRAVFIDRDGTIARDVHFCRRPEDFEILPTVHQAIRMFNRARFKTVVITNQSGVARGYFTDEALRRINRHMEAELARCGARLDAVYYCPHHPDDGCQCRKPKPGLIFKAAADLDIRLTNSFMVGDGARDVEAGKAAGCRTVLVTTGPEGTEKIATPPDYIAASLVEAALWITGELS